MSDDSPNTLARYKPLQHQQQLNQQQQQPGPTLPPIAPLFQLQQSHHALTPSTPLSGERSNTVVVAGFDGIQSFRSNSTSSATAIAVGQSSTDQTTSRTGATSVKGMMAEVGTGTATGGGGDGSGRDSGGNGGTPAATAAGGNKRPPPPPLDTMRAYRACLNCRGRKSKCDLDINQGRPVGLIFPPLLISLLVLLVSSHV